MDDDQTCPESVLLVAMERAFRGPEYKGTQTSDWQPHMKRVLQCVRENDPMVAELRTEIERLRTIVGCECIECQDDEERVAAEYSALKMDAERYRWLRERAYNWPHGAIYECEQEEAVALWVKGEDLDIDAAVDALIEETAS